MRFLKALAAAFMVYMAVGLGVTTVLVLLFGLAEPGPAVALIAAGAAVWCFVRQLRSDSRTISPDISPSRDLSTSSSDTN